MMSQRGVLSTDAYQVTMAQLYHRLGLHERRARFEHFYRSNPDYGEHQAGYCITAGLGPFIDWVSRTSVTEAEVEALRVRLAPDGWLVKPTAGPTRLGKLRGCLVYG